MKEVNYSIDPYSARGIFLEKKGEAIYISGSQLVRTVDAPVSDYKVRKERDAETRASFEVGMANLSATDEAVIFNPAWSVGINDQMTRREADYLAYLFPESRIVVVNPGAGEGDNLPRSMTKDTARTGRFMEIGAVSGRLAAKALDYDGREKLTGIGTSMGTRLILGSAALLNYQTQIHLEPVGVNRQSYLSLAIAFAVKEGDHTRSYVQAPELIDPEMARLQAEAITFLASARAMIRLASRHRLLGQLKDLVLGMSRGEYLEELGEVRNNIGRLAVVLAEHSEVSNTSYSSAELSSLKHKPEKTDIYLMPKSTHAVFSGGNAYISATVAKTVSND